MRKERPHVLLAMCQHEPGWTHEPRWPSAPTPADERRPRRSPPCRPTPPGVCGSIPLAGACGWRSRRALVADAHRASPAFQAMVLTMACASLGLGEAAL